jgi:hypothetical protein
MGRCAACLVQAKKELMAEEGLRAGKNIPLLGGDVLEPADEAECDGVGIGKVSHTRLS